jgi:hypothetical protein
MFACQNTIDGLYLTARGFAGNGPAWDHETKAATFETREEAEQHAEACEVRKVVRIVEID